MPRRSVDSGQSPKPDRDAKLVFREDARQYAGRALEALADISVNGKSEASRIAASKAIIERVYGRPGVTDEADLRERSTLQDALAQLLPSKPSKTPIRTGRPRDEEEPE